MTRRGPQGLWEWILCIGIILAMYTHLPEPIASIQLLIGILWLGTELLRDRGGTQ